MLRASCITILASLVFSLMACSGRSTEDVAASSDSQAIRVCAPGPTLKGVDVSYYQGTIDWDAVKASGHAFAFARVSDGTKHVDNKFAENWDAIKNAGLVRGAYQYFRPAQDPQAQAELFVQSVGTLEADDLPAVLDVETQDGVSNSTIRENIKTWLDYVGSQTGKTPMIYTAAFMNATVGTGFSDYPLWVANYGANCPSMPGGWSEWRFWQSSEKGSVSGIQGDVDVDLFNGTLADLRAFAGGPAQGQDQDAGQDPGQYGQDPGQDPGQDQGQDQGQSP